MEEATVRVEFHKYTASSGIAATHIRRVSSTEKRLQVCRMALSAEDSVEAGLRLRCHQCTGRFDNTCSPNSVSTKATPVQTGRRKHLPTASATPRSRRANNQPQSPMNAAVSVQWVKKST